MRRAADDPLRADNVREAARMRRATLPDSYPTIAAVIGDVYALALEAVHDRSFAAGVAYALRAVRAGAKS